MHITPDSWGTRDAELREGKMRELLAERFGITTFEHAPRHAALPPDERQRIPKTIGYSPRTGKWYGWSHRAVAGFKIGSKVTRGHVLAAPDIDEYGRAKGYPIGFTARTEADAKQMAADFAGAVS